jgi:hypothetical protein
MLQACERNYYPSCLNLGLLGRAWLFYVNVSFNMMQKVFRQLIIFLKCFTTNTFFLSPQDCRC